MKKNLLSIVLLISSCAVVAQDKTAKAPADMKIGYVELPKVMQNSKEGQAQGKELQDAQMAMMQELQQREQKLIQELGTFKTSSASMSEDAREKRQKELAKDEREYKALLEEYQITLNKKMQKANEAMLKQVEEAAALVAKNNKLDAVVDAATGRVMYIDPKVDCTNDLIKQMDKAHEVKLAKASTAKPKTVTA